MTSLKVWSVASLVALCSAVVLAQDPLKVDPAHYKLMFENAGVRVLHINYAVGAKSIMHQHPDAIVTPIDERFAPTFTEALPAAMCQLKTP